MGTSATGRSSVAAISGAVNAIGAATVIGCAVDGIACENGETTVAVGESDFFFASSCAGPSTSWSEELSGCAIGCGSTPARLVIAAAPGGALCCEICCEGFVGAAEARTGAGIDAVNAVAAEACEESAFGDASNVSGPSVPVASSLGLSGWIAIDCIAPAFTTASQLERKLTGPFTPAVVTADWPFATTPADVAVLGVGAVPIAIVEFMAGTIANGVPKGEEEMLEGCHNLGFAPVDGTADLSSQTLISSSLPLGR